jgi:chromosome segregation ATPase
MADIILTLAALKFADLVPVLSGLASGAFLTGAVQWRKSKAENSNIVASATKQAIQVFEASIEQLRKDLSEATAEAEKLQKDLAAARTQVIGLINSNSELEAEVLVLRARLRELDRLVRVYESKYGSIDLAGP